MIFLGNFFFYEKNPDFQAFLKLFTASVRSLPPGPPAVPGVFQLVNLLDCLLFKADCLVHYPYIEDMKKVDDVSASDNDCANQENKSSFSFAIPSTFSN